MQSSRFHRSIGVAYLPSFSGKDAVGNPWWRSLTYCPHDVIKTAGQDKITSAIDTEQGRLPRWVEMNRIHAKPWRGIFFFAQFGLLVQSCRGPRATFYHGKDWWSFSWKHEQIEGKNIRHVHVEKNSIRERYRGQGKPLGEKRVKT